MMKYMLCLFTFISLFTACQEESSLKSLAQLTETQTQDWNKILTDAIMEDVFTPPVASRIYAYCNIAAYEVVQQQDNSYVSLGQQLNGLPALPEPANFDEIWLPVASAIAFSTVAKEMVHSREMITRFEVDYLERLGVETIDTTSLSMAVNYGQRIGQYILKWAKQDGFEDRHRHIYATSKRLKGKWVSTPPNHAPAIEPNWQQLRPFVMSSSDQFRPPAPTRFDTLPDSDFYAEATEVYETVNRLNEQQLAVARFWDCNPNISFEKGYAKVYRQQITPGGHWMLVTGIAVTQKELSLLAQTAIHTLVAIALADAFISCWQEKYTSNLIRPQTYINAYIDPNWRPVLQTPAFPEYTSGHSVISAAAATILTSSFGANFTYTDNSEEKLGLPPRTYQSFQQAADEAAISRLYGGIHYRPSIEQGVVQGEQLGNYILERIQLSAGVLSVN
jgi:hypothetical protein